MTRVLRSATLSLAALTLVACAALPDDAPVVEQLDNETGATITRLGQPVELYRETVVRDATGRFAFFAPFETNQMGARQSYLWIAVPIESPAGAEPPAVTLNGQPLVLGAPGRAADFAGLKTSPYKLPTPWSSTYYYRIDAAVVAALRDAREIGVTVAEATPDGAVRTPFGTQVGTDPRLREFAARQ
jgi:hypothetical protein